MQTPSNREQGAKAAPLGRPTWWKRLTMLRDTRNGGVRWHAIQWPWRPIALCGIATLLAATTPPGASPDVVTGVGPVGRPSGPRTEMLRRDLEIPIRDEAGRLGAVDGLAVDRGGRIFALDRKARVVRVFDSRGHLLRELGGRTSGYAALIRPVGIAHDGLGRLWVVDPGGQRYVVFDSAGVITATYARETVGEPTNWHGGFDAQGRLYDIAFLPPPETGIMLMRCSPSATDCAPLALPGEHDAPSYALRRGRMWITAPVPFTDELLWRLDRNGALWAGSLYGYRLVHQSFAGRSLGVATRSFTRAMVTNADRIAAMTALGWFTAQGGTVDSTRFGRFMPVLAGAAIDESGKLWVQPRMDGRSLTTFDVFRPNGRYVARYQADVAIDPIPIPYVTAHAVYGVTRTARGDPVIVRLHIGS